MQIFRHFFVLTLFLVTPLAYAERLITVESEGQVSLAPNRVSIQLELWSKSKIAKTTQAGLAENQQKVRKIIEQFKIKPQDVQSQSFNLNPEYEYDQKTRRNVLVGYSAVESLLIQVLTIKDLGPIMDSLSSIKTEGATGVNIQNLKWDSSERAKAQSEALTLAVQNAKKQATHIAKAAGLEIKKINKITYAPQAQPGASPRMFEMKAMVADSAAGTVVSEGQILVRSAITMEFEIK